MKTTERLTKALEKAGAPHDMIERARMGDYDDFESNSATPIMDLVRDCRAIGLTGIMKRAMDGEFDSTKEESEQWFNKEGHKLV